MKSKLAWTIKDISKTIILKLSNYKYELASELTCTAKSGEHVITPTTRRECPSCRLKQCFRVGMRPDLIQVRKKDGSKPRWLDKVPRAAIVHEQHLQSSESLQQWLTTTNNNNTFHKTTNHNNSNENNNNINGTIINIPFSSSHRIKYRSNTDKYYKNKTKELRLRLHERHQQTDAICKINNIITNNNESDESNTDYIKKSINYNRLTLNSNESLKIPSEYSYPTQLHLQQHHQYNPCPIPSQRLQQHHHHQQNQKYETELVNCDRQVDECLISIAPTSSDIVKNNIHLEKDIGINSLTTGMATNNHISSINNNNNISPKMTTNYFPTDTIIHLNGLIIPNSCSNHFQDTNILDWKTSFGINSNSPNGLCINGINDNNVNNFNCTTPLSSSSSSPSFTTATTTTTTATTTVMKMPLTVKTTTAIVNDNKHSSSNLLISHQPTLNFNLNGMNQLDDLILLADSTQLLEQQNINQSKSITSGLSPLSFLPTAITTSSSSITTSTISICNDISKNDIISNFVSDSSTIPSCITSTVIFPIELSDTSNCLSEISEQSVFTSLWNSPSITSTLDVIHEPTISIISSQQNDYLVSTYSNNSINHSIEEISFNTTNNDNSNNNLTLELPLQSTVKSLTVDLSCNELSPLIMPSSSCFSSSSSLSSSSSSASSSSISQRCNEIQMDVNSVKSLQTEHNDDNKNHILPVDLNSILLLKQNNSLNENYLIVNKPDDTIHSTVISWPSFNPIDSNNFSVNLSPNDNKINQKSTNFQNKGQLLNTNMHNNIEIPLNLDNINKAWSIMWQNGIITNPEMIDVNLDLNQRPTLKWCLTIANIWSDLFLRRVSVFAMSLLGDLIQNDQKSKSLSNNHHHHQQQNLKINESSNEYFNEFNQVHELFHQNDISLSVKKDDNENINSSINDANNPYLTWDDMLWIAKNRFTDCVPVLLISCSSFVNKQMTSSSSYHENTTTTTIYNNNNKVIDFELLSPQCSINHNHYNDVDQCSISSNITKPIQRNTNIVYFQTEPNCIHLIDLTKLSHALGELGTEYSPTTNNDINHANDTNLLHNNKRIAYPILKYLDAYISQLGSFLAHHPLLLGVYMALKLTDPILVKNEEIYNQLLEDHNPEEIEQQHGVTTLKTTRTERLQRLHKHFLQIFNEAVDFVALETTQLKLGLHTTYNQFTLISQEKVAANSRRVMLSEFLNWSREFDATWHSFQGDIWRQATYYNLHVLNKKFEYKISKGLNALFHNQLQFYTDNCDDGVIDLIHLLWDAKNEHSLDL
ncbi:nuclear hormone receptor [Schistosoma japonicum]|nr:nuclear hormone receptor [Schistosoma japonicum]